MNNFISGALLMAFWAIGLCFARFWRISRDRFFGFFALAFWLMAVERVLLLIVETDSELRPYVYITRLIAFLVIIYAILDKNRAAAGSRDVPK